MHFTGSAGNTSVESSQSVIGGVHTKNVSAIQEQKKQKQESTR
jgi:hypothetical protein